MSSTSSVHVTLAAPGTRTGDILHDSTDYLFAVAAEPRRAVIADAYAAIAADPHHDLSVRQLYDGGELVLAQVEPRGPVAEDDGLLTCRDGWTVTSIRPTSEVLGPQAEHLAALATALDATAQDAPDGENARLYAAAVRDLADTDHLQAALSALNTVGADTYWWERQGSYDDAGELVALAARDLIGTVPGWDWNAYRALMTPWVTTHGAGTWPHPDDQTTALGAARRRLRLTTPGRAVTNLRVTMRRRPMLIAGLQVVAAVALLVGIAARVPFAILLPILLGLLAWALITPVQGGWRTHRPEGAPRTDPGGAGESSLTSQTSAQIGEQVGGSTPAGHPLVAAGTMLLLVDAVRSAETAAQVLSKQNEAVYELAAEWTASRDVQIAAAGRMLLNRMDDRQA